MIVFIYITSVISKSEFFKSDRNTKFSELTQYIFFHGGNYCISIFLFCEFIIKKRSGLFREMNCGRIRMYFYM